MPRFPTRRAEAALGRPRCLEKLRPRYYGSAVWGLEFSVEEFRSLGLGFGFGVSGFYFGVWGSGFRVGSLLWGLVCQGFQDKLYIGYMGP